jgi:DNA-directed RNA polymerase subunit M/transcription elongation factor TFIIS
MTEYQENLKTLNSVVNDNALSTQILAELASLNKHQLSHAVFEFVGSVIEHMLLDTTALPVDVARKIISEQTFGWGHMKFNSIKTKMSERDDFILKPFDVEEGTLTCKKCKSKKVFSYSKQIRSSDEPASVFAQCIECKSRWIS